MKAVGVVHNRLRSLGFEVVRYPPTDEKRSKDLLLKVFKKLSIDCVFDVGANHGAYGEFLRDIGYKGWILSFEPMSAPFADLAKLAAARPPWRVFQYALGSENGQAEINVQESDLLTSFLNPLGPSKTLPKNHRVASETVQVKRLDSIFDECMAGIDAQHVYLKIDTQGFDLEVLRGAEGILDKIKGAQSEVSFVPIYEGMPNYNDSIRAFQSKGFSVVDFMPVSRVNHDFLMMEMDCVFARSAEFS